MPLRNRIAQADAARDGLLWRQAQGRTAKLENDIRQQIENAAIARSKTRTSATLQQSRSATINSGSCRRRSTNSPSAPAPTL